MKSEIFDNYAKIALEKGWVKKAESRVDKVSDKDYQDKIKALYGIDIKTNNSDKSLVEQAHPDKAIVGPAYDKVNALVENIQERSNIMCGIALRNPQGQLNNKKNAKQELINELVRIGFDMENQKQDELRALADKCSNNLVKEANPAAVAILPLLGYAAAALGVVNVLMALKEHVIGHYSQGVNNDVRTLIDSLTAMESTAGVQEQALSSYVRGLEYFLSQKNEVDNIIKSAPIPNTPKLNSEQNIKDFIEASQEAQFSEEEKSKVNKLINNCRILIQENGELDNLMDIVNSINPEQAEQSSEWVNTFNKWIWEPLKGNWGAAMGYTSERNEVVNSIATLKGSIRAYMDALSKKVKEARQQAQDITNDLRSKLEQTSTQEQ